MNAKIKHPEIKVVYKMPHCKVEKKSIIMYKYNRDGKLMRFYIDFYNFLPSACMKYRHVMISALH